jgi:hypothetical protein
MRHVGLAGGATLALVPLIGKSEGALYGGEIVIRTVFEDVGPELGERGLSEQFGRNIELNRKKRGHVSILRFGKWRITKK